MLDSGSQHSCSVFYPRDVASCYWHDIYDLCWLVMRIFIVSIHAIQPII